jgi:hypothetical protein
MAHMTFAAIIRINLGFRDVNETSFCGQFRIFAVPVGALAFAERLV